MEQPNTDPLAARHRRLLVTGAGGQLGRALQREFAGEDVLAVTRGDWDVSLPAPELPAVDLVLHAAAWTDVDGPRTIRRVQPRSTSAARSTSRRGRAACLLLERLRLRRSEGVAVLRIGRAESALCLRPLEARLGSGGRRTRLDRRGARGSLRRLVTTSSERCFGSVGSATRSQLSTTSAVAPRTRDTSRLRRASSWTATDREVSGTSQPPATARGRNSPRRSSRRPISTAVSGGSRRPSSGVQRRDPRIRSCAASVRVPPSYRIGVTA